MAAKRYKTGGNRQKNTNKYKNQNPGRKKSNRHEETHNCIKDAEKMKQKRCQTAAQK